MSVPYNNQSTIKSWAEDDRPREKLLKRGKQALTDAELIAILIGSGTQNATAVELSRKILATVDNNLSLLGRVTIKQLTSIKGIGQAKAITILSAIELGRRRQLSDAPLSQSIKQSQQAYDLVAPFLADLTHEEFWIITLNRKNVPIQYKCMTKGGFSGTIVDTRQVFYWAIQEQASSIILAHNHPSGTLKPSSEDIQITNRLVKAGQLMDIKVLDHLIITNAGYYSFADNGKL